MLGKIFILYRLKANGGKKDVESNLSSLNLVLTDVFLIHMPSNTCGDVTCEHTKFPEHFLQFLKSQWHWGFSWRLDKIGGGDEECKQPTYFPIPNVLSALL